MHPYVLLTYSYTDQNNTFGFSNGTAPDPALYWNGRFTNEPGVWVDYLERDTAIGVVNLAYAGAFEVHEKQLHCWL
jgi:hypothetical protein